MYKIKINNNQFKCPMLNLVITERGNIDFGTCRICKNNILARFVDDYVYCNYGSSSSGGSSEGGDVPSEDENYDPWNDYVPNNP